MRASRGLLILALVTVVAVIACWFAIDERYSQVALEKQEGGLVFPALQRQVSAIAEIEVAGASGQFALSRSKGGWANMGIGGYPARSTRVEKVIGAMAGLRYIEPKTGRSKLYHKLDVEDVSAGAESTRLTIKDAAGAVLADIIAGKPKNNIAGFDRQGVYVRLPGDERAWLVEGTLDVRHDAVDWSDRMVVDIDARSLTALSVRHADGEILALHRNQPQDRKLTLKNLPVGAKVEHQHQIDYMAGLLQGVRFNDAKRTSATDLEAIPAFEAMVQSKDHLAVTLRASEPAQDGSLWARIDAQVTDDAQASDRARREATRIRSNFGGWSLKLPRTITDRLKIRVSDIIKTDTASQVHSRHRRWRRSKLGRCR